MHKYMYMYMHTSVRSITFALGHCLKFSSAAVLARSLYFSCKRKISWY